MRGGKGEKTIFVWKGEGWTNLTSGPDKTDNKLDKKIVNNSLSPFL